MLGLLAAKAIPWKLIGAGILIAALAIMIAVHISNDNGLKNKIDELNGHITQLEIDKEKLKDSNVSLELDLEKQSEERDGIVNEYETLQKADAEAREKLANLKRKLTDIERKKRIDSIISTRKRSLLLRMANSQAKCQLEHFEDYDGFCSRGKWKLHE